jgi:hypothetical protein
VIADSRIKLRMITVSVQAKRLAYSKYDLALKISIPIDFLVAHNTSAATPAFHPRPIDDINDETKYGNTDGI